MTALLRLPLLALLALASFSHAEPKKVSSAANNVKPEDFVLKLYAEHSAMRGPLNDKITPAGLAVWFTKGLAALMWKELGGSKDEVGKIDFDVLYSAQDTQITKLRVSNVKSADTVAAVTVAFKNFDKGEVVRLNLRRVGGAAGGWRICNIIYDDFDLLSNLVEPDDE